MIRIIFGVLFGVIIGAMFMMIPVNIHYNRKTKAYAALLVVTKQIELMPLDSILLKYQHDWINGEGSKVADSVLTSDSRKVK